MKRIVLALTLLLVTSGVASAQFTPSKENLRALTGVRVIVMYGHCPTRDFSKCAEGLDEAQRAEVLRMLEADTKAKLEEAGIPVNGLADKRNDANAGDPKLIVMVTLDRPNGFIYPIETEVKLLQKVRLSRDPSIEFDAMTWSTGGTANKLEIASIRRQIAEEIDGFVQDYQSVNPKQSANSTKQKSK